MKAFLSVMSDKVIDAKLMWLWYQGARTEHVRKHWFVEEVVRPLLLRVHILPVHAEEVLPVHTPGVELLLRRTQLLRKLLWSSGKGQARIGKVWPKAKGLKA